MNGAAAWAAIDAAVDRALDVKRRWLKRHRPGLPRRLACPKPQRPPRDPLSRREAFFTMRRRRDERLARHREQANAPATAATWREHDELRQMIEQGFNWAEARSVMEVMHAIVRDQVAARLDCLARSEFATQEPAYYEARADRLRKARRYATWGHHRETRKWKMFFHDRSGLVRLDPSEARHDQCRQIRQLKPRLQEEAQRGKLIYSGVFTMPNAPADQLAAAKRAIFDRFKRSILGRDRGGKRDRHGGAFPEIEGAYVIQEDPLSARGDWNVHLNALLVVDPKKCTPLDPELDLDHPPGRSRKRARRGLLCYKKVRYVWGYQLKLRKIEARNDEALERAIVEAIKYPVKWVSSKQLADGDHGGRVWSGHAEDAARAAESSDRDHAGIAGRAVHGADPDPAGKPEGVSGADRRAPGIVDWPLDRLAWWIDANRGFRRARGFGCLYRLKDPPPEDDERDYRILGDVTITLRGAIVCVTRPELSKSAPVNSIHGDKSGGDFSGATGRGLHAQARAGPATGAAMP